MFWLEDYQEEFDEGDVKRESHLQTSSSITIDIVYTNFLVHPVPDS